MKTLPKSADRSIVLSGPEVRALRAGRQTVLRRPVGLSQFHPSETPGYAWTWRGQAPWRSLAFQRKHPGGCWQDATNTELLTLAPYGAPGGSLWVREAWACRRDLDPAKDPAKARHYLRYRAEYTGDLSDEWHDYGGRWRPATSMPRWAARLALDVTAVRVEDVRAITSEAALAEGIEHFWEKLDYSSARTFGDQWTAYANRYGYAKFAPDWRGLYAARWDATYKDAAPWARDPNYVWCAEVRVRSLDNPTS